MVTVPEEAAFVLGKDYHLGDFLWFTTVLRAYREQRRPASVTIICPDRPISRILEQNLLIDRLQYADEAPRPGAIECRAGEGIVVHDLRVVPLGLEMVRQWRRRLPWLYYRDLWLEPRGQWLATFLGLGDLGAGRPVLNLSGEDRSAAAQLPSGYIVLAPHIGQYSLSLAGAMWRRVKGWPTDHWARLARLLAQEGFEPVTLAAPGQAPIDGTRPLVGLPIRQAAGIIEGAAALVTGESGLWFVAAALGTPFAIVPWWLPRRVDWAAPSGVPYRLVYRDEASVSSVLENVRDLVQ